MKKVFMTLMAIAAIAMCFTSCKKNNNDPDQPGGTTTGDGTEEQLRFYFNPDQLYYVDVAIDYYSPKGEPRHVVLDASKGEDLNKDYATDKLVMDKITSKNSLCTKPCVGKAFVVTENKAKGWKGVIKYTVTPKTGATYTNNSKFLFIEGVGTNHPTMQGVAFNTTQCDITTPTEVVIIDYCEQMTKSVEFTFAAN